MLIASAGSAEERAAVPTLSESELVARALARPALRALAESRVQTERERAAASSVYTNPQLVYVREQTFGALGTAEDYATAAQVIDLGGRRRLRRAGGDARVRARDYEQLASQIEIATEVRRRVHEALFREARRRAYELWLAQIDRALAVVARRADRGDAAEYDRVRLAREQASIAAQLEAESSLARTSKRRIGALAELEAEDFAIDGALLPEAPPLDAASLIARLELRPDVLASTQEERAARLDARAAARQAVPDLRIEGGYKGVTLNAGGRTDGFLAGGALTLPLFDRGAGGRRAAEAEARGWSAGRALLLRELKAEVRAARESAVALRDAAVRFRESLEQRSSALLRIANASYEGGEMGVFELCDAHRSVAEDELSALELEHAARLASIELEALTAGGAP